MDDRGRLVVGHRRKGGHLVLVTGRQGDTVYFRNPSGHTEQARAASLPVTAFAEFFGGRGVSLTRHR
ncbi:hypothetical protein ACFVYE_45605 [Streptomyces sp. NPDC058239]|uniref:hypothetical protein n=1 Tax=Streptomyces sp. NPDC058239 TaxID=3346395 RepID=UPI0036E25586